MVPWLVSLCISSRTGSRCFFFLVIFLDYNLHRYELEVNPLTQFRQFTFSFAVTRSPRWDLASDRNNIASLFFASYNFPTHSNSFIKGYEIIFAVNYALKTAWCETSLPRLAEHLYTLRQGLLRVIQPVTLVYFNFVTAGCTKNKQTKKQKNKNPSKCCVYLRSWKYRVELECLQSLRIVTQATRRKHVDVRVSEANARGEGEETIGQFAMHFVEYVKSRPGLSVSPDFPSFKF